MFRIILPFSLIYIIYQRSLFCTVSDGDYYRLLHDGDYEVTVTAEGYHPSTKCVTVENVMYVGSSVAREAEEVDFTLTPASEDKPEDAAASAQCERLRQAEQAMQSEVKDVEEEEKTVVKVGAGVNTGSAVNTGVLCRHPHSHQNC